LWWRRRRWASRDDERGVLVLSSFAGASRELSEALIVSPYDTHAMAYALNRALLMPEREQRDRMRLMRETNPGPKRLSLGSPDADGRITAEAWTHSCGCARPQLKTLRPRQRKKPVR
jgi:Glycosyltransferase family 20